MGYLTRQRDARQCTWPIGGRFRFDSDLHQARPGAPGQAGPGAGPSQPRRRFRQPTLHLRVFASTLNAICGNRALCRRTSSGCRAKDHCCLVRRAGGSALCGKLQAHFASQSRRIPRGRCAGPRVKLWIQGTKPVELQTTRADEHALPSRHTGSQICKVINLIG